MIDEFFTNLREEIDAVLRLNGKSENDIMEVLLADDDDDGFVSIDPREFLEKAADTVYITGSEMESLREMRIRGKGFEIHTDLEYCIEDSHVQYLRYRSTSSERYDGCLIRADRYVRSEMECHGLEEDARYSDASLVERKMDRLIEAAKANGVVHMTVQVRGDGEGNRSCRGDASMFLCGGRTVIMYKCDRMIGSEVFRDEANRMLGVNAIVMNLTGLKTPLEGRTVYGSEPAGNGMNETRAERPLQLR